MGGWADEWISGLDEWMNEWADGGIHEWIARKVDGQINGWMSRNGE